MRIAFALILAHPEFLQYYLPDSQGRMTKYGRDESCRPNSMSSRRHENHNARNKRPGSTITDLSFQGGKRNVGSESEARRRDCHR
jgi:hypothetical protein